MRIHKSVVTPLGIFTLASDEGMLHAFFPGVPDPATDHGLGRIVQDGFEEVEFQLDQYFAGHRCCFDLEMDTKGTEFQHRVWAEVSAIPYGQTCSYKELAIRLGDAAKARSVGAALSRNPLNIIIPTHRVVGSRGSLTGYSAGIDSKRFLLEHERSDSTAALRVQCAGAAGVPA
ncbi:methylated-DNA-[protein]-cysteine S-methyltransferase [Arthrobacter sp. UYP6]|uniref:methylated-DNA--[protein]-cysteine S-methyltransferase n=1 Tax=Arthrobacter sp. UYP6 TaxID=1756378 RepID=UPI003391AF94